MIDHVGFPVSDYARARAFYEKALAPLGYTLVMEVTAPQAGQPAAGFGSGGKPDFWIGAEGKPDKPVHIAILAKDRPTVDAFHRAALAAGREDKRAPGVGPDCNCRNNQGVVVRSARQHTQNSSDVS